jgi:hypothetical protein
VSEYYIDPITWFSEREIKYTPKHFVVSTTSLTPESKNWILKNLNGRFSVVHWGEQNQTVGIFIDSLYGRPAFEDPKEALLYELTWS